MIIAIIPFDEIGLALGGGSETVGFFYGTAAIDRSGHVVSLDIETYDHATRVLSSVMASADSVGLTKLLFHALGPVVRQQCAARIADEVRDWHDTAYERRGDYQRETAEMV